MYIPSYLLYPLFVGFSELMDAASEIAANDNVEPHLMSGCECTPVSW